METNKLMGLIVASCIALVSFSARANFAVAMNSNLALLQTEVETQLRANPDVAQLISRAAAAGIHMPTLMRVLVKQPGVNIVNAVGAAVRAVPGQGADIVGYAVLYGGTLASPPAVITAGIQAAAAQANAMLRTVLALVNGTVTQKQVFLAAIAAAPDQLDSLVASGMLGPMARVDSEWVAVAAVQAGAAVNVVVACALRTAPARAATIITAVLRAGASPAAVDTAARGAGVTVAVITAAFSAAGVAYPVVPPGQILGLTIVNTPPVLVQQVITVRLDGNGTCAMEANLGGDRVIWAANRPNFWGVPTGVNFKLTPGRYVYSVRGVANGGLPACEGSAQATVDVVAR